MELWLSAIVNSYLFSLINSRALALFVSNTILILLVKLIKRFPAVLVSAPIFETVFFVNYQVPVNECVTNYIISDGINQSKWVR